MTWLARKINRSRWPDEEKFDVFELNPKALQDCLRVVNNGLSVWKVDNDENLIEDLKESVLLLATNPAATKIEAFDIVVIDGNFLSKMDIKFEEAQVPISINNSVSSHYDILELNYFKLGLIAEHIISQISKEKVQKFTIKEIKDIILEAHANGRVIIENLKEELRQKLGL